MQTQGTIVCACVIFYDLDGVHGYVHRLLECSFLDENHLSPLRLYREKSDMKEGCEDTRFPSTHALLSQIEPCLFQVQTGSRPILEKVPLIYHNRRETEEEFSLTSYRIPLQHCQTDNVTHIFPMPNLFLPAPLDSFIYPQSFLVIGLERQGTKIPFRRLREWMRIFASFSQWSKWMSFDALITQQNKKMYQIWDQNSKDKISNSDLNTCFIGLLPKRSIVPPERVEREEFHEVLTTTAYEIIHNNEKSEQKTKLMRKIK
jgi:hypothetical protein